MLLHYRFAIESFPELDQLWAGDRGVPWGIHRSKGGVPIQYRGVLTSMCPEIYQSSIRFQYLPPAPVPPIGVISVLPSLVTSSHSARPLVSVAAYDVVQHLNAYYALVPRAT